MSKVRDRDGVWQADCVFVDENGKRQRVQRSTGIRNDGTRTSRRNAEKAARDIESALADGRGRRAKGLSLATAFEQRVAEQKLAGAAEASIRITLEKAAHTLEHFGERRDVLRELITSDELKEYAREARARRAIATVTRELVELRCALRCAGVDPLPDMPELGTPAPKEIWLRSEQAAALIAELPESRREHAITYLLTGARWSELYRLQAHDVRGQNLRIRGTKTETTNQGGADRTIPLHPGVTDILARRGKDRGPLFADVWEQGNGNRDLTSAARRAGLKFDGRPIGEPDASGKLLRISFNVLRASFCTQLVLAGVPLKKIAYMMGHRTTHMVERVYTRFFGDDLGVDLGAALVGPYRHGYVTEIPEQEHSQHALPAEKAQEQGNSEQ